MKAIDIEKAPEEILDFNFDFRNWPMFADDTIASATLANWNNGALDSDLETTVVTDGTIVQLRIGGGVPTSYYYIKIHAVPTLETDLRAEAFVKLFVSIPPAS